MGPRRRIQIPSWTRRRWFHTLRLLFWLIQIPPAVLIGPIRESVPYLVFLSLAALVESSATDVDQARMAEINTRSTTDSHTQG